MYTICHLVHEMTKSDVKCEDDTTGVANRDDKNTASETPQELVPSTKETGSSQEGAKTVKVKVIKEVVAKEEKKKKQRFRGKNFELTIPQCEIPQEEGFDLLETHYKDLKNNKLKNLAVVQEEHTGVHGKAKTHHLHCVLIFEKTITLAPTQIQKAMKGHYPHCATIKNLAGWLGYISKKNMPTANFDLYELAWSLSGDKARLVKSMMNHGWRAEDIIHEYQDRLWKENFISYIRKAEYLRDLDERRRLRKLPGLKEITREFIEQRLSAYELHLFDEFEGYGRLIKHINDIRRYQFQQPHGYHINLLVTGKTGIGKSLLMRKIMKWVPTYEFPIDNWHPDYEDDVYTLISWDEPKLYPAHREDYLRILDGLTSNLPVKGSRAVRKNHQKIIMTSNKNVEELMDQARFHHSEQRKAFSRRLDKIDFEGRSLIFLLKLIEGA